MLHILHIDRSALYRKVMHELITHCGHGVSSVATLAEAEARLAEGDIDLIFTALEFEDGSGEDFIRGLSQGPYRDIPVIVITATESLEARERHFALGVVDYLLKGEIDEARLRRYLDALAVQDELSRFMRGLRVAVLDDSRVILKLIANILKLHGFESVRLFEEPLALIESGEEFDLYLVDFVLPGITGEQVVSLLRERRSEAIIICMSQFATDKSLTGILLAGADDYIPKPFDALGLMSRIKVNIRSFQLKRRLEKLAITDGLTGLFNHRYAYDRLEEEVAKARRYGRPLALLMADVDDFKRINDERGHRAGDEALARIAAAIRECLRRVDVAGRYGGEEFIILLPETGLEAARNTAEKLRRRIAELEPGAEGRPRLSVSVGVAEFLPGEGVSSLVGRADSFLYEAKRAGKNRVAG